MGKIGGTTRRIRRFRENKKRRIKRRKTKKRYTKEHVNKSKSSHGSSEDPNIPDKLRKSYSDTITTWIRILDPKTNEYYYWNRNAVNEDNPNGIVIWTKPTYGKIVDMNTDKVVEKMSKTSSSVANVDCYGCIK